MPTTNGRRSIMLSACLKRSCNSVNSQVVGRAHLLRKESFAIRAQIRAINPFSGESFSSIKSSVLIYFLIENTAKKYGNRWESLKSWSRYSNKDFRNFDYNFFSCLMSLWVISASCRWVLGSEGTGSKRSCWCMLQA